MSSSLADLRVLDLSRILAGPMATQTLADLGAEVIKIERPGAGDDTRSWGPPFLKDRDGRDTPDSTYFACCNRGKKSVAVDLARPEGQALVRRLAAISDVVVENYKVGDLSRYGLDYASLSAAAPRLVYCSITGYGQTGPYRTRAGYDPIAQAVGGLMSVTGEADGEPGAGPQRVGVAVVDLLTANYAVIGILAALRHRDATGEGQHVDMSLLDVQVASMINVAQAYLSAGQVGRRNGNEHPSVVPSQAFRCADGMIMLAAANNGQFARLCEVLGRAELARDPRYATNDARVRNRTEVKRLLQAELERAPVAHWVERLSAAGLPAGPVNDMAQVFQDPQVVSRGLRIELDHPESGPLPLLANPIKLSGTPPRYALPPPVLGEHTDAVLSGLLGMNTGEIAALRRSRVIQ